MSCENSGNAGRNYCKDGSIFGKPSGIILAKKTFTQTAANFLLQSEWVNAIQSEDVFPIMEMKEFNDVSSDATYHEYGNESRKNTSQGKYRFEFMYDAPECQKKELINFRQYAGLIYFVYVNNVMRGRSVDAGVNVVGMRTALVNIEKETFPGMDGTPAQLKVAVDLLDEADANEYDYSRQLAWSASLLDSLTPVNLAQVGTATATALTLSVSADCYGQNNPISGLVLADFAITGTGTLDSVAEDTANPGNYVFVTTGLISTDSVNLVEPESLTADLLIKSSGAVVVTVT